MKRSTVFGLEFIFLIVLLLLGLFFFDRRYWPRIFPDNFGPIPLGVPWFGALGAVLISLAGVFDHKRDWDPDFWPWHIARPLIGGSLGIVSVLTFKAGILAVGSNATPAAGSPNLLYYLIAFVVGYREETFRELIKRLADVILTPGNGVGSSPLIITGVIPATAPRGMPTPVIVTGKGFKATVSVKFGETPAKNYNADSDTQLSITTPVMSSAGDVNMLITSTTGSALHSFNFS